MAATHNTDAVSAVSLEAGQVWQSLLGERIEIISTDGPYQKPLTVRYPEREGQPEAQMSRYNFADAANYEGYTLLGQEDHLIQDEDDESPPEMAGSFTSQGLQCPCCGSFMSKGWDGQGFPTARCSQPDCPGVMDASELIEAGHFEEGN